MKVFTALSIFIVSFLNVGMDVVAGLSDIAKMFKTTARSGLIDLAIENRANSVEVAKKSGMKEDELKTLIAGL